MVPLLFLSHLPGTVNTLFLAASVVKLLRRGIMLNIELLAAAAVFSPQVKL